MLVVKVYIFFLSSVYNGKVYIECEVNCDLAAISEEKSIVVVWQEENR